MKNAATHDRSRTAPLLVLGVFLLLVLTRLIDRSFLDRENETAAVIVLELLIFMLPAVLYLRLTGIGVSQLRLRPVGLGHLLLLLNAVLLLICGGMLIGFALDGYGVLTERYDLYGIFVSKSDGSAGNTLYLILAYAALPALCEEFVFRAVLCSEYEKRSTFAALLLSSVFFAMLHFDLTLFPTYLFSGFVLGLVFYSTRSVLGSVTVHFCYNLFSVFGRPLLQTVYDLGGQGLFTFIVTAFFLLSAFIFCAESSRLYRTYSDRNYSSSYRDMDPPYRADNAPGSVTSPAEEFALRHPRLAATLSSVFSPTALVCYVFYVLMILRQTNL